LDNLGSAPLGALVVVDIESFVRAQDQKGGSAGTS